MNQQQSNKGDAPPAETASLLNVVRNVSLYPVLRALLNEDISCLNFKGALPHFTYRSGVDEVIANQPDIDAVTKAMAVAIGKPRLRARATVQRKYKGQLTLVLPPAAKQACLMELLALAANLSSTDLAALPPPVQVQGRDLEQAYRQGGAAA